jgi:signal transduction histidine kinase/ligand-binding sensor domain-containing protein
VIAVVLKPRRFSWEFRRVWRQLFIAISLIAWLRYGHADADAADSVQLNYFLRFWQMSDNGLPENNVTAVVQTRDGYIWSGTRSGLARFDGVHFTIFDNRNTPELHSSHVTCLFEASDGALWIGHDTGDVTCYKSDRFENVPLRAAWHRGKIFAICSDASEDVWLLNQDGELARARDGLVIKAVPGPVVHLLSVSRNPAGGFWIQRDNDVTLLEHGRLVPLFDEPSTNGYVQGICACRDGGLWVMVEHRIRKWKNRKWVQDYDSAPWQWSPTHDAIETKDGYLAVATAGQGLYIGSAESGFLRFCRTNGFSSDWVNGLCEDREGNLWVGTGNGGLAMLRTVNVKTLSPPDQWQGRSLMGVAVGTNGSLWIGTEGAGLYRLKDSYWTNYDVTSGLAHLYVWSVAPDASGGAWAGTWGSGIFEQRGEAFGQPDGIKDLFAAALHKNRDGTMLIGTSQGLLRFQAGRLDWLARKPELSSPDVRTICEGPDGALWFGMSGGGLACLQGGKLRQFRSADGLANDFVQCLHLEDDGTLWIGTFGGGLNRLKQGRFAAISSRQGLASDIICDIEDDGLGYLWVSSHGGIARLSKDELDRCANGQIRTVHCLSYGLSDGLPTLECSGGFQPAGCKTPDGRLLFPTSKGLVAVDPANVRTNGLPPPVLIEDLFIDDQPAAKGNGSGSEQQIQPGRHRLEFRFTGLSFTAPEKVRFKYRLEKLETEWVEAGTKRFANYSYVPPGHYTFKVIACNNDEVWNEAGAKLSLAVLPYFWQTVWFRALAGALLLTTASGIVWFDTRRRMHRKLEGLERQRALERERARIAKDIHDDLGASLTRITMLSLSARDELDAPAQAATKLDRIYGTARELTRSLAEIVWAVNPMHDTLDSLASYLGKFAQDFLGSADIRCRLELPVDLPHWPLTAEARHNLFLAFKESLNNVVKHAGAAEVQVSLEIELDGFLLTVVDDGHGFVVGPVPAQPGPEPSRTRRGNGLGNMRQRLEEIGGRCGIQSSLQKGTRVEFHVPAKVGAGATTSGRQG